MKKLNTILANATFAIIVMLTFLLFFEHRLELPAFLQSIGRMHPLLLHIPIGVFVLVGLLVVLRKQFQSESFERLITFLLHVAVLSASITALMGLFLSREGGYDSLTLALHKWFGVGFCYTGALLLLIRNQKFFYVTLSVTILALVIAGHYGATLTHGDNFVLAPLKEAVQGETISENSTLYEAGIEPLFERKCASCHNETKAKGKLILTSLASAVKGGKSGALWDTHNPGSSVLIKRLLLPLNDKKHMPPKDKPQLTADEMQLVALWIKRGADTRRKLTDYADNDSLTMLVQRIETQELSPTTTRYRFPFADAGKVTSLNTPNRSVVQLAQTEPALQASFFGRQAFAIINLEELKSVSDQLVSLSLAKMPVNDNDLKLVASFKNLEVLNLNNTDITGITLTELQSLEQLHSLSLSGTKVTAQAVEVLKSIKNLKKVFIWNTFINAEEAAILRKTYPHIAWETGYVPDATEKLQLSAPLLVSESVIKPGEAIVLKASLPGTTIRYTSGTVNPDSVSGEVYTKPIQAKPYQVIKAIAYKDGWKHSPLTEFVIFQSGYKPSKAELKTLPEPRYPGEGAATFSDGKKGSADFFRDPTWIGYRERPLEVLFWFDDAPVLHSVTLSYSNNTYAMTMPPAEVEIWGGDDDQHLVLLQKVVPLQPQAYGPTRVEGVELTFGEAKRKCYKLIAKPLGKLPAFRESKDKGWLMADEIYFH